ncbi:MAG: hypothetical protein WEB60_01435 [Terrimicrobiaceae bacterium]
MIPVFFLGVLMAGCSAPAPRPPEPSIVVVPSVSDDEKTIKRPTKTRPVSPPRPKAPAKIATKPTAQSAPPTSAERPGADEAVAPESPTNNSPIASLVTAGRLESATSGQLIFASNSAAPAEDQGLFEDAILLSRVRAGLKAVAEPDLASTAKVSSGTVTLDVPAGFEPKTIAAAVDTALSTSGVRKVQVNMAAE